MPGIVYTNYHVPDSFVTIEDIVGNSPNYQLPEGIKNWAELHEFTRERLGFDKIAIGTPELNLVVFSNLMAGLFKDTNIKPEEISYIIETDQRGFNLNPRVEITNYLRTKYKLKNSSIFTLSQACGAIILAIGLASTMLTQNNKYIVILSDSTSANSILVIKDRLTPWALVLGDGASIIVIGKKSYDYEIVDYISSSSGLASYKSYTKEEDIPGEGKYFGPMHKHSIGTMRELLKRNGLSIKDIFMMIPPSTNYYACKEIYPKALGIPEDKIFMHNIPNGGHMGNVDIPRNFKDFTKLYNPDKGAYLLITAGGFSFPAGDYVFNALLVKRK